MVHASRRYVETRSRSQISLLALTFFPGALNVRTTVMVIVPCQRKKRETKKKTKEKRRERNGFDARERNRQTAPPLRLLNN